MGAAAVVVGVSLVIILVITLVWLLRRRTPGARYGVRPGTVDGWAVAEQGDRRDDRRRVDAADLSRRSGRVVSSEHVTEQVPLAEIREGDMLQDPKSGNWIKVVQTADGTTNATRRYSDGERTVIEQYRVYYGDGGEEIDSRFVKGLVTRQVRE